MPKGNHRQTKEGYTIIENMAVLPIVFLVVYALLFAGFLLHAQCTIESAARRGVLYGGKLICDPQYGRVTASAADPSKGELNEMSGKDFNFAYSPGISYQPYRYIPFISGNYMSGIDGDVKSYVCKILDQSSTWMFRIEDSGIQCKADNFVVYQNMTVKITAKYPLPKVFVWLGVPESYDLKAEAVMTVSDQDEFIRNADYVGDLIDGVLEASGAKDKIEKAVVEPLKKMKDFMSKLFK